jgi:uncharacterized protein (DUF2141 family)
MLKTTSRPAGGVWWSLGCAAILLAVLTAEPARADGQLCAGSAKPKVNVVIEGVRSDRGEVVVELYPDDPDRFLASLGRVERIRRKAERTVTNACIVAPSAGRYALVLYHDENDDEVFNRNRIGLPSEGFGFSNNVRPLFGPPSLKSVLFDVPEGETTVRVHMRYLGGGGGSRG